MHAVPGEDPQAAVVHAGGHGDGEGALAVLPALVDIRFQVDALGHLVQLLAGHDQGVEVLVHQKLPCIDHCSRVSRCVILGLRYSVFQLDTSRPSL